MNLTATFNLSATLQLDREQSDPETRRVLGNAERWCRNLDVQPSPAGPKLSAPATPDPIGTSWGATHVIPALTSDELERGRRALLNLGWANGGPQEVRADVLPVVELFLLAAVSAYKQFISDADEHVDVLPIQAMVPEWRTAIEQLAEVGAFISALRRAVGAAALPGSVRVEQ